MVTAVWANTGEDKVTQEELRTVTQSRPVLNSIWDGTKIRVSGAKNEVVSFTIVAENDTDTPLANVAVAFNSLTGPNGAVIQSQPRTKEQVFDWTTSDIELFVAGYLQIKGLSILSYDTYDERHIPPRFQSPNNTWATRPDKDKFYPDIAYPMELFPNGFSIAPRKNQSVTVDVYIAKDKPAGLYTGTVTVGASAVPVELTVHNFALPDIPSCKTMLASGFNEICERYGGIAYPNVGTPELALAEQVRDRQFLLAHRHKISMIDDNQGADVWTADQPRPYWLAKLNGSFFTAANGYRGPGENTGNNVYSIHTYGSWQGSWGTTPDSMRTHATAWEAWFAANSPQTERFLYLIDESSDYAQTEGWAAAIKDKLKSFATANLLKVVEFMPSLDKSASWITVAPNAQSEAAFAGQKTAGKSVYLYNGVRPATGSFATEDEGVALPALCWAQYKKKIDRWFFWLCNYYNDYQGGRGQNNVFVDAQTFGGSPTFHQSKGMTGWNHSNGDGVLFYPGTDKKFPTQSRALAGPIASLRLKLWRRGIQDVDYLTLAHNVDAAAVDAIVQSVIPKVIWENDVADINDPTWQNCPVSWSTDPDVWQQARAQLAGLIAAGTEVPPLPPPPPPPPVSPPPPPPPPPPPQPPPLHSHVEALRLLGRIERFGASSLIGARKRTHKSLCDDLRAELNRTT